MSKYEVIIYWSKDDQSFIAEVPDCRVVRPMESHIRKLWRMSKP